MLRGKELVYPPPLPPRAMSHAAPPVDEGPAPAGQVHTFHISDVQRWGKIVESHNFVKRLIAVVNGIPYALMGGGRTKEEESFLRRLGREDWARGAWLGRERRGFAIRMRDGCALVIRTLGRDAATVRRNCPHQEQGAPCDVTDPMHRCSEARDQ